MRLVRLGLRPWALLVLLTLSTSLQSPQSRSFSLRLPTSSVTAAWSYGVVSSPNVGIPRGEAGMGVGEGRHIKNTKG